MWSQENGLVGSYQLAGNFLAVGLVNKKSHTFTTALYELIVVPRETLILIGLAQNSALLDSMCVCIRSRTQN
jgi:hypothetical protein